MKIVNIVNKLPRLKDWAVRPTSDIKYLIIHHDVVPREGNDVERYKDEARFHMSQGWPGLGYHFKIAGDGTVYRCNRNWEITYHASNYNSYSIGICLDGFLHPGHEKVTSKQRQALFDLIDRLRSNYNISRKNVLGHRDVNSTACPGDYGYIQVLDYRQNKKDKNMDYKKKWKKCEYYKSNKLDEIKKLRKELDKYKREHKVDVETNKNLLEDNQELSSIIKSLQDRLDDRDEKIEALKSRLRALDPDEPIDKPDTESSLWNKLVKFIKTVILRRKDEK